MKFYCNKFVYLRPKFTNAAQLPFTTLHLFVRKHLSLFFMLHLGGLVLSRGFF